MIVTKKRRSFWQWLADKAHRHIERDEQARAQDEKMHWLETGLHLGIVIGTEKPASMSLHTYADEVNRRLAPAMPLLREMIAEQARVVAEYLRFEEAMAARTENLAAPPVSVAVKPTVRGARQVASERRIARVPTAQIFPPDSLKRMIDTSHIPAVARGNTGVLFGMHLGKQKAQQERQGG